MLFQNQEAKNLGGKKMKKILSFVLTSMVAVAFAGITFAAEPPMEPAQPETPTQAAPAKPEKKVHHKKHHKKHHHKKHHKKHVKKEVGPAPEAPPAK
jgi:ribosomal protein L12E/L44/L45/RPP1/RPP2